MFCDLHCIRDAVQKGDAAILSSLETGVKTIQQEMLRGSIRGTRRSGHRAAVSLTVPLLTQACSFRVLLLGHGIGNVRPPSADAGDPCRYGQGSARHEVHLAGAALRGPRNSYKGMQVSASLYAFPLEVSGLAGA